MSGGYTITAQYYDPLMAAAHADVDRQIVAALAGLDTSVGPIVDIGAGTGLSTALIARTLPDAAILAVEPDPAMRPALMTRVCADADLRRRVSILPMPLSAAPLPAVIAGVVMSAALVHFDPDERADLWRVLAQRLHPQGLAIVEIQPPPPPDLGSVDIPESTVGDVVYSGSSLALQVGPGRTRWNMAYTARLGRHELAYEKTVFDCWTVSAADVEAEARAAGLAATNDGDLILLHAAAMG